MFVGKNSGKKLYKRIDLIRKQLNSLSTASAADGSGSAAAALVLFQKEKSFGKITLNNPKSLNALNLPMIRTMQTIINQWQADKNLKFILMSANGGKAFCAGGKIA